MCCVNFMMIVGLAVCDNPQDADLNAQNAFMRSPVGKEYEKLLAQNLQIHKSLMGAAGFARLP